MIPSSQLSKLNLFINLTFYIELNMYESYFFIMRGARLKGSKVWETWIMLLTKCYNQSFQHEKLQFVLRLTRSQNFSAFWFGSPFFHHHNKFSFTIWQNSNEFTNMLMTLHHAMNHLYINNNELFPGHTYLCGPIHEDSFNPSNIGYCPHPNDSGIQYT